MAMTRSEAGIKGAFALNSDPEKKRKAAKLAAKTRMKENPNVFREMGRLGGSKIKSKDS